MPFMKRAQKVQANAEANAQSNQNRDFVYDFSITKTQNLYNMSKNERRRFSRRSLKERTS